MTEPRQRARQQEETAAQERDFTTDLSLETEELIAEQTEDQDDTAGFQAKRRARLRKEIRAGWERALGH